MALASAYTGEAELDAVMDLIEPVAGIDDAAEAVLMGLVAVVVRAFERAQASTGTRNRLGEKIGSHTANLVMQIATWAPHVAREFRAVPSLTNTELDAADGEAHNFGNLGPIH